MMSSLGLFISCHLVIGDTVNLRFGENAPVWRGDETEGVKWVKPLTCLCPEMGLTFLSHYLGILVVFLLYAVTAVVLGVCLPAC